MTLDQAEKLGNILVSILTALAIVVGGGFSYHEYLEHKKDVRIKASLVLVHRYNSAATMKHTQVLNKEWQNANVEFNRALTSPDAADSYNKFVLSLVDEKKLETSLSTMFGFYDNMVICVESKICEREVIDRYFREYGKDFFNKYYPYVCHQRIIWSDDTVWLAVQNYFKPQLDPSFCETSSAESSTN